MSVAENFQHPFVYAYRHTHKVYKHHPPNWLSPQGCNCWSKCAMKGVVQQGRFCMWSNSIKKWLAHMLLTRLGTGTAAISTSRCLSKVNTLEIKTNFFFIDTSFFMLENLQELICRFHCCFTFLFFLFINN